MIAMDTYITKKRSRQDDCVIPGAKEDEDSTDVKLAILASLHPGIDQETVFETLLASDGSVDVASAALSQGSSNSPSPPRKKLITERTPGYQSSLSIFSTNRNDGSPKKSATKKGKTLYLYSPEDIAAYTPCSIIHNFLPGDVATDLLKELLAEAPSYYTEEFQLFERTVKSPHTFCFYVDRATDAERQKKDYVYNGGSIADVRCTLPHMQKVSAIVQNAVNEEIKKRIISHYPDQKKLKYQSPDEWIPNASFVNCYDGPKENVGYHSDELTYIGPRAVIGSLSLGVAREFRVRKVVPRYRDFEPEDAVARKLDEARADTEGQISIHLPHNSLLVMHAEMQEEWKHSIAPAQSIDPHPIAGNKRLNVTYRCYKESFDPRYTPKCRCGVACTLKCVQKQADNRGRYMWMCHTGFVPGGKGCQFFAWADFDDNGEPPWSTQKACTHKAFAQDETDAEAAMAMLKNILALIAIAQRAASSPKTYACGEVNVFYTGFPAYHPMVISQGFDPAMVDAGLKNESTNMVNAGYNFFGLWAGTEVPMSTIEERIDQTGVTFDAMGIGGGVRMARKEEIVVFFEDLVEMFARKAPHARKVFDYSPNSILWSVAHRLPMDEDCKAAGKPGKLIGYEDICDSRCDRDKQEL